MAEEQLASLPASLIDKEATGKLILHKKADPSSSNVPTGEIDPQVTGTDLPGVGFTLYKIRDIDLYSNAGVKNAAEKMNQPKPANQYLTAGGQADLTKVTEVKQGVTDEHGMIEFSFAKGELGAYLVVETGPKPGYTPASPFIAFIPMTKNNGQDGEKGGVEWNYNVHAYPKNFKKGVTDKIVEDSGKNGGDTVTYTVSAVPQGIGVDQKRTVFKIQDTLDEKLAAPEKDSVKVSIEDAGDKVFTEDVDYEVTVAGQTVTVTFKDEGLAKLTSAMKVSVEIPATVKDSSTGILPNQAQVFENNPNDDQDKTGTPSETPRVKTYFGDVTFDKIDGATNEKLAGAKFALYGAIGDQECVDAVKAPAQKLRSGGKEEWISAGGSGQVTITGLHVNDIANEKYSAGPDGKYGTDDDAVESFVTNKYSSYCLVETEAPKGYELLPEPIKFDLKKQEVVDAQGSLIKKIGTNGKIENLKDTTPNLPMTGGAGIGILAALGALIIGAGAWLARRNSAKN